MNWVGAVRALGPIDLKSVQRDALLRWMVLLPVLIALLLRWGVPSVARRLQERAGFELEPYYVLIASLVVLITPMLAGVVIGFLLLDQRDDGTLTALQVTPLSLGGFLTYRIGAPVLVSVAMTMITVPATGLVSIHPAALLLVAILAAPMAPIFALFLGAFAGNKIQGFALMKAAGAINWPPMIAFFLPPAWQLPTGIVPTFWPAKLFWTLAAGDGAWLPWFVVGLAYQFLLLALLLRRFRRVVER